ncbi:MAG: DMT family transporter [Pseudomonadota bacterium]
MNDQVKGLLITGLGVIFVSPDTLLIRLVDTDLWTTAFWRGLFTACGLTILLLCTYGRRTPEIFRAIGAIGLLVVGIFVATSFSFLSAVIHTTAANALIVLATAPFFAAVLSSVFLKEAVPLRTWLAIAVAIAGITLIAWTSIGAGTLFGDFMALVTAGLLGLKITILRSRKAVNMIPALAISSLIVALVAWPMGTPFAVSQTQMTWLLIMGFIVITPASALIALGPRYIAAPEVALLILLETVLGPLWVWLVVLEEPSALALLGGTIVVTALAVHAAMGLRFHRQLA